MDLSKENELETYTGYHWINMANMLSKMMWVKAYSVIFHHHYQVHRDRKQINSCLGRET